MALTDIISKQVVVLKADASQFKAEMKSAGAAEQAVMKERLAGMERQNAALERSSQKFALWAAAGVAGFSIITSSVKKYEDHLRALGPAGESELKKITDASGQLTKAQDTLQISIAKLALVAAPAATELAKMADSIARIVGGIGGVVQRVAELPGVSTAAGIGFKAWKYSLPGVGWAMGAADAYDYVNGPEQTGAFNMPMSQVGRETGAAGYGDGAMVTEHPAVRAARLRDQARRRRGGSGGGYTLDAAYVGEDATGAIDYNNTRTTFDRGGYGGPVDGDTLAKVKDASNDLAEFMKELEAKQKGDEKSAIEKIVGPIEEFDKYAIGFGLVRDAATSAYDAMVSGSMSAGEAIKKSIGAGINALGKDMLIRSLQEGAWAIADLAKGNVPGAALHGKASFMFAAGAVAAGVAARGLSSGGGGGSANANAAAGLGGGSRSSSGDRQTSLTVVMGDSFAGDSPRYVARKVRRNYENARQYATYGQEDM